MNQTDPNLVVREQWRTLGFYYNRDDDAREWQLVGSRQGLLGFAHLLTRYTDNPRHNLESEHDHFGPYMYLKIMTWPDAGIDRNAIHGTLADLRRLAKIVHDEITEMQVGEFARIQHQYVSDAQYAITLDARCDGTDPSTLDPELSKTAY